MVLPSTSASEPYGKSLPIAWLLRHFVCNRKSFKKYQVKLDNYQWKVLNPERKNNLPLYTTICWKLKERYYKYHTQSFCIFALWTFAKYSMKIRKLRCIRQSKEISPTLDFYSTEERVLLEFIFLLFGGDSPLCLDRRADLFNWRHR